MKGQRRERKKKQGGIRKRKEERIAAGQGRYTEKIKTFLSGVPVKGQKAAAYGPCGEVILGGYQT